MPNSAELSPPVENIKLSGARKAAMLIMILGEEYSASVMRHLGEDEVHLIGREIARIPSLTADVAEQILEEYHHMTLAHEFVLQGGVEYAKRILLNAFNPDYARLLLDRLVKTISIDHANFDTLQRADPQQLAKFIHSEHPQTIALILSHLDSTQAAALLNSLPVDIRADVSLRMANLDQISPDIIGRIATIIAQKLKNLGQMNRESYGGVRAVAEMFNRLDSTSSKEILDKMQGDNPALGETVRNLMFVFDDLLRLEQSAMEVILARVDRKLLTVALKGTSDQLRGHFLKSMSQRGADMFKEEMENIGPVKIKDVEAAQQQVIATVRQLESEGAINLGGDNTGDQYVV